MSGIEPLTLAVGAWREWVEQGLLVFARVAAVFSMAPVLGSRLVPMRVRVACALAVTGILLPQVPQVSYDPLSPVGVGLIALQIGIGLGLGFLLQLVFNAATLAGEVVAMSMGLGFAQMVDPQNGVNVPVVSQFYLIAATLLFLALDGHLALLSLLAESFVRLDAGLSVPALLDFSKVLFDGALVIAIPVVTGLLIVNLTLGVMTRSAPQLNLFAVGFPVGLIVGFVFMLAALPALQAVFTALLDEAGAAARLVSGVW
ncbi:MAG: flagellar biosynthetic protein FliR [Gammaproteobacteria bacterium]|nr:MAG: flagellar biosynthetic protein FliR [Gammaproteobacteria bacterium]